MYQDGDILHILDKDYVVLGIYDLNDHNYIIYPDSENLFEQDLNPNAIMRCVWHMDIELVGYKNKKEFNLWLMKNKMLYDLPFITV